MSGAMSWASHCVASSSRQRVTQAPRRLNPQQVSKTLHLHPRIVAAEFACRSDVIDRDAAALRTACPETHCLAAYSSHAANLPLTQQRVTRQSKLGAGGRSLPGVVGLHGAVGKDGSPRSMAWAIKNSSLRVLLPRSQGPCNHRASARCAVPQAPSLSRSNGSKGVGPCIRDTLLCLSSQYWCAAMLMILLNQ